VKDNKQNLQQPRVQCIRKQTGMHVGMPLRSQLEELQLLVMEVLPQYPESIEMVVGSINQLGCCFTCSLLGL